MFNIRVQLTGDTLPGKV